mgnify:CR=1 FL=1
MAESTLTQAYYDIRRDIGRVSRFGRSYSEGTLGVSTATCTVSSASHPIPDDIASYRLQLASAATIYTIASRTSDTVFVADTNPTSGSGQTYEVFPWSNRQLYDIKDTMQEGYQQFLNPPVIDQREGSYRWKWLNPIQSVTLWPDTTGTVSGTPSYSASTTNSTITATADKFFASMIGHTFTFGTSSTGYTINGYTSARIITVSGNASGEASGDTFSIAADGNYRLADDFAGVNGTIQYEDDTSYRPEIQPVNVIQIYDMRQGSTVSTGAPNFYAVDAVDPIDATVGQRYNLLVYPEPDSIYTVRFKGQINPNLITAINKYGLGGMPHSLTFKESCLAVAERKLDDTMGIHQQSFMSCLAASISHDKKNFGADSVGFNLVGRRSGAGVRHGGDSLVKYDGTLYDNN